MMILAEFILASSSFCLNGSMIAVLFCEHSKLSFSGWCPQEARMSDGMLSATLKLTDNLIIKANAQVSATTRDFVCSMVYNCTFIP